LTFVIIVFNFKQGAAINVIWALTTWQTDNGALLFGSLLGKHAMAPRISPKKTWEGVSGGIFLR
jgi:phosphatidate cytidylyltransferase